MLNLLYNYKNELENSMQQLQVNNKVKEIFSYLESRDTFVSFDISNYIDLFNKAGFSEEELKTIKNNIRYIQAFFYSLDTEEYNNYINVFKEKFNKLKILIKDIKNENLLKEEYDKINKLIDNLKDKNAYIEDIDFIFRVFEHNHLLFKDVKEYLKEIIEHNKKVVLKNKEEKEELIIDDEEHNSLLDNILKTTEFSNIEKNILTNFYQSNQTNFEIKYNYLRNEFKYIFSNMNKYKKLFIVLMMLSNIDDLNNIIRLAKDRNLNLKKMLPNIYVSKNNKFIDTNGDEYYSLFRGSYEDFISNLKFLPNDLDLSKVEPTYYITDSNLIRNNYNILVNNYKITIDVDSIECLTIDNLQDKLDKIIESGLYDYFKENPRKMLEIKDDLFFYRVKYAKDIGETYKRKHLSKDLFEPNGYKININNYQDMVNTYNVPLFAKDEFHYNDKIVTEKKEHSIIYLIDRYFSTNNPLIYQFGNILVSKNKVISLYNKYINNNSEDIKTVVIGLFYSIFDGLIINKSETLWIINSVIEKLKLELINIKEEEFDEIVDIILDDKKEKRGKLI